MSKLKLFLCVCICVLSIPAASTKGDYIQVENADKEFNRILSDLIVYGDPNNPEQKKVLLAPNDPTDDIELGPYMTKIFEAAFTIKSYVISQAYDTVENYIECETSVFNVKRLAPKKLAMIQDPAEQQTIVLAIDQDVALVPPPEGTILTFSNGRNELRPGWFVGTGINFETGDVTGAYSGDAEVLSTAFDALALEPPYPPDGATDVPLYANIFWPEVDDADHYEVFFGKDCSKMSAIYQGNQDGDDCSFDPGTLEPCTTYYWKINTVCIENGGGGVLLREFPILEAQTYVIPGVLQSFTTGYTKATNPYPADGAIDVDPNTMLSWMPGCEAIFHNIYLGESYDDVADANSGDLSGIYRGVQDANSYLQTEVPLDSGRTYYWRIDEVLDSDTVEGSIWQFTTKTADTGQCTPTEEELTPPATPEGYEYVGYTLVVNHVSRSTIPEDYTESPDDIQYIRSRTTVEDAVTVCDIIVSFLFKKVEDYCGPTEEEMTPPATPEGYEYVGYDVVVNFVLTDSTIPLDYPDSPEDISVIRSHTTVKDGQTICDVVVRHLFKKKE